jgi:predicted secreted protein
MTAGIKSHGTKIAIGDGASPEGFTTITEAFTIPAVGGTKGTIDMSNHDSTGFKEFLMQDLAEGLELAIKCNMIPDNTSQELVVTAWENSSIDNWRVTLRGGKTRIFPAVVLHVDDDPSELDGRTVFNFTLKIAGDIARG